MIVKILLMKEEALEAKNFFLLIMMIFCISTCIQDTFYYLHKTKDLSGIGDKTLNFNTRITMNRSTQSLNANVNF